MNAEVSFRFMSANKLELRQVRLVYLADSANLKMGGAMFLSKAETLPCANPSKIMVFKRL
jgi:hypothetical protein